MTDRISEEKLGEILAGCEGATPGPWKTWAAEFVYSAGPDGANICAAGAPRASKRVGYTPAVLGDDESAFNAIYIASVDPTTVSSAFTELRELREALQKAEWALRWAAEDLADFEAGTRSKRSVSTSTSIVQARDALRAALSGSSPK